MNFTIFTSVTILNFSHIVIENTKLCHYGFTAEYNIRVIRLTNRQSPNTCLIYNHWVISVASSC